MFNKSLITGAMLALAPLTASAQANAQALVDATDPAVLASLIQDLGYKAKLTTDSVGDPMISSSAHGYDFDVFFYDCTDNANCRAIQFSASFDMTDGMSLTRAEDFNRDKRWVKVYLNDESDPRIEMDYNLYGGVSVANFNDTVDWWQVMMQQFIDYIDF